MPLRPVRPRARGPTTRARRRRSSPTADRGRGRGRRDGLDAYELAVLRGSDSLQGDPEAPDEERPLPKLRFGNLRVGSLGLLVGVFAIFLIGSGVRYGGVNRTPNLATSCTAPALALSATSIVRGHALYVAVTGPQDSLVIAIDAAGLSSDLTARPIAGAGYAQVIRPAVRLTGCKGKAVLGVQVPTGKHTVSTFPAAGGAPLASKPLTVTDR